MRSGLWLGLIVVGGLWGCAKPRDLLCPLPTELPAVIDEATYNGHTYQLLEPSNWCAAESAAEAKGARLVTINDLDENTFVLQTFGGLGSRELWLSLNDIRTEGLFTWPSGLSDFYNWAGGEPNEANDGEDCAVMKPGGAWNDYDCEQTIASQTYAYIYGVIELEYLE